MKLYSKTLMVSFNNEGVVTDADFTTAGDK